MKYYTLHELMITVNRHIQCNTNFPSDHLLPNIHYIYTPQKRAEKPKNEKLEKTLAEPKPRISEERITISVHGLALTVGKAEALKIAQSIMNQIGG